MSAMCRVAPPKSPFALAKLYQRNDSPSWNSPSPHPNVKVKS